MLVTDMQHKKDMKHVDQNIVVPGQNALTITEMKRVRCRTKSLADNK